MDGFAAHRGIVVIAATNRPDILDQALLRPGPLRPPGRGRRARPEGPRGDPQRAHPEGAARRPASTCESIARGTPGFSGADLANLVNEAALLAARGGRPQVGDGDLDEARDKVLMGVERRSLVMTAKERVNCAYHEAGHALVAALHAERRPAPQGDHHAPRPRAGRDHAAAGGGPAHPHRGGPRDAGRDPDGRPGGRGAADGPHHQRRRQRHRPRHRDRAEDGVRAGHVAARPARRSARRAAGGTATPRRC